MKSKQKLKQTRKIQAVPVGKLKRPWWLLAVAIAASAAGFFFWGNKVKRENSDNSNSITSPASLPVPAEHDHLVGRWVRTDSNGGYTLEIKNVSADGKLEAQYFNPNPIKVGHAEWMKKDGNLVVVVELRDINYPGSIYTLNFSQKEDRMSGTYYQAVEGVNFDVAFARTP